MLVSDRIYLVMKGRTSTWHALCRGSTADVVVGISYGFVSYLGFFEHLRGKDFELLDDEVRCPSCYGTAFCLGLSPRA